MADGSARPIASIKVGDQIANALPGDAKTSTHTVTAIHVSDTDRDFVDLTIATPAGPKKVTTTGNHRFYDARTLTWTSAAALKAGDQLDTPGEGRATILEVHRYTSAQRMYNLTVDGVHTYYVEAGATPVLVHNECGPVPLGSTDLAKMAYDYRIANKIGPGQNVAVYEYDTGAGPGYIVTSNTPGGLHSEQILNNYLKQVGIDPESVTGIYSERMPCTARCAGTLGQYKNAQISWSLSGTSQQNYAALQGLMAYGP